MDTNWRMSPPKRRRGPSVTLPDISPLLPSSRKAADSRLPDTPLMPPCPPGSPSPPSACRLPPGAVHRPSRRSAGPPLAGRPSTESEPNGPAEEAGIPCPPGTGPCRGRLSSLLAALTGSTGRRCTPPVLSSTSGRPPGARPGGDGPCRVAALGEQPVSAAISAPSVPGECVFRLIADGASVPPGLCC